jgi:hypothetical protein
MKRAMSGKTRRGAPPLPRQRKALRIAQLTLIVLAVWLAQLAAHQWTARNTQAAAVIAVMAVLALASAIAMGVRTVRGPEPPRLD